MLEGARVAVVVPAHDEARLISRTIHSIPDFVDLVVVVDDASRDETAERVAAVGDPRVELIRHRVNRGVGAAITSGYRRAFARGAEVAAVMAGDAQMDPADLAAVLGPVVRREADYAKGDRLSHPQVLSRMPMARWVGNHALSSMTRLVTGLGVNDSQCGYTALSRDGAERIGLERVWTGYGYPNDLLSRAAVAGLKVQDVTVRPVYGEEKSGIRTRHLFTTFPYVFARGLTRRLLAGGGRDRPAPADLQREPTGRRRAADLRIDERGADEPGSIPAASATLPRFRLPQRSGAEAGPRPGWSPRRAKAGPRPLTLP